MFSLTWLPEVLRAADLKVAITPGWENRGHGDAADIVGVLCHHTVGSSKGNMPSLQVLIEGRKADPKKNVTALKGPLAHLGLGRDGTFYVIAAGATRHAGTGSWNGITTGNQSLIGIEAENTGSEAWPDVQMDAYRRGVAAILRFIGRDAESCAAHKEYAPKRKPNDPGFDMEEFRDGVAAILNGTAPAPILIPKQDGKKRRTLRRGDSGPEVARLQQILGVSGPALFGPRTEAAVRAFQRGQKLVPDGIVGPKTWEALEK